MPMTLTINGNAMPAGWKPDARYYKFEYPEAQSVDGLGRVMRAAGQPWAEIGMEVMPRSVWDWFMDLFADASTTYVSVIVAGLFNPRANTTGTYVGKMLRPAAQGILPGWRFRDATVRFVELVAYTAPEAEMSYAAKVLSYGPIAYWRLNEGAGATITDFSGNGFHGTSVGWEWQAGAGPDGGWAPFMDGVNSHGNVWSEGLRDAFNGAEGTVVTWPCAKNVGVWTDGELRIVLFLYVDNNNMVEITRKGDDNSFQLRYRAGGTSKIIIPSLSFVDFFHVGMTWSKFEDEMRVYIAGLQTGLTQTGLGVWVGNLSPANTIIGALNTTPLRVWYGWEREVALFDRALTPGAMADLAVM